MIFLPICNDKNYVLFLHVFSTDFLNENLGSFYNSRIIVNKFRRDIS